MILDFYPERAVGDSRRLGTNPIVALHGCAGHDYPIWLICL